MSRSGGWARRLELVPGEHRPKTRRNGAIFLVVVLALVTAGYTKTVPFRGDSGRTIQADFARATHARKGTAVRVRGVDVGTVTAVESQPGGGARITMRLDTTQGYVLRRDTRATLLWRTLLGRNMYVDLDPGTAAEPLGDHVVARTRTGTQVELDEVLEPLDADGRASVTTLVEEFDRALERPDAAGAVVDETGPAMRSVRRGLAGLRGERNGDLTALVADAGRAFAAMSRDEAALGGLIDSARLTMGATAAQRIGVTSSLRLAPGTLAEVRRTAVTVRRTLDILDPVAAELRPGARLLQPTLVATEPALRRLRATLHTARPTLKSLEGAVVSLGSASRMGLPLVTDLEPTVARTRRELLPWLEGPSPDVGLKVHQTIGPALASVGSGLGQFDVYGHSIRFQPGIGEQALEFAPCHTYITDPQVTEKIACDQLGRLIGSMFGAAPTQRSSK